MSETVIVTPVNTRYSDVYHLDESCPNLPSKTVEKSLEILPDDFRPCKRCTKSEHQPESYDTSAYQTALEGTL